MQPPICRSHRPAYGGFFLVTLRGLYGYGCSLTRPVTYRSKTEGAAMPLRSLYGFIGALTRPVTYRSETEGVAEGVLCPGTRLSIEPR